MTASLTGDRSGHFAVQTRAGSPPSVVFFADRAWGHSVSRTRAARPAASVVPLARGMEPNAKARTSMDCAASKYCVALAYSGDSGGGLSVPSQALSESSPVQPLGTVTWKWYCSEMNLYAPAGWVVVTGGPSGGGGAGELHAAAAITTGISPSINARL